MSVNTVVHWFRKDLRIHDNPALRNAINEAVNNKKKLRSIFIINPDDYNKDKVSINRLRFLLQSLKNLNHNLKEINTKLYVIKGNPYDIFSNIFKHWKVNYLTFQVEYEPDSVKQDDFIEEVASKYDVFVVKRLSHTIYDPNEVIKRNNGQVPMTYQKFLSLIQPIRVKDLIDNSKSVSDYCTPVDDEEECKDKGCYDVPKLTYFQIEECENVNSPYQGGETEALKRMHKVLLNKEWVCKFEKPNTSPNSLQPSTTVLSPYLSNGCLSSRLLYYKIKEIEKHSSHSEPPVSLFGQLMWREFYYTAAAGTVNFDKMLNNPICIQISWQKNAEHLQAWEDGKTGYPFVDAIMRQLKQEGWIHHLARHMVACFLTRGDLWISWEDGMKVFEKYLLDYDWALNTGNWLWLSASAFFYKYFRVYSPVAFGKKTDKDGLFIREYVPELKKYPSEFIFEPWKAPKNVQKSAGCVIGVDYPNRIIDHEKIHKENISKMANYYKLNREKKSLKRPRK